MDGQAESTKVSSLSLLMYLTKTGNFENLSYLPMTTYLVARSVVIADFTDFIRLVSSPSETTKVFSRLILVVRISDAVGWEASHNINVHIFKLAST